MKLGVLALQGDFREHIYALDDLGVQTREVRLVDELLGLDGLIIPGGESTTMAKLMKNYGFDTALNEFYKNGSAIWGTCAGAIAVAKEIVDFPQQASLELMDIAVDRNSYGRQVASFEADVDIDILETAFHAIFIRAPRIMRVGEGVEVLARYNKDPIMARQGRLMATVFHPELEDDRRIHEYFINEVVNSK